MGDVGPAKQNRLALIMMVGAPGTGKTYVARRLAAALGATLVQTDAIRKQHFHPPRYTPAEHATVYRLAHEHIRRLLSQGRSVIFDATNLLEDRRQEVYRLAEEAGAALLIIWTYAPEAVVAERLRSRAMRPAPGDLSDATWEIYLRLRQRMDPIPRPHFLLNTAVRLDRAIERLLAELQVAEPL